MVWSLLMTTPAAALASLSSREIRWRSTSMSFCNSVSSETGVSRARFMGAAAATASRQRRRMSARSASAAQPGKRWAARLRASRMRVMSTIAHLLLAASVSSERDARRASMVMGWSARGRLRAGDLFGLVDFIAVAGGVFITLVLDGGLEIGFEFAESVFAGFALKGAAGNFARVQVALVHVFEHGLDKGPEGGVTLRAAEAAVFLEVALGEAASLAAEGAGGGLDGIERGFDQQVRERESAGISHPLGLRAGFAQVHLVHLVVHDLREVHRGGLVAEIAFKRAGHGKIIGGFCGYYDSPGKKL